MARLLIPTRNRPASLRSVIAFLDRFYPGTGVIVADGSADAFAEQNAAAMADSGLRVDVEYRRYPYETPFFDRLLHVLESIDDPFVIMGSDDDFPLMDVLGRAEKALAADRKAATAMGPLLHLFLKSPTDLQVRLGLARPIMAAEAERRARAYAAWSFSTTYAVTRRELLIERYQRARELFLVGFYDFGVGLHDCMHGRIRAVPEVGFIASRNYNHSYLRPEDRLVFLRRSAEVLQMTVQIAQDLQRFGGLSAAKAEAASEEMIRRRVAENAGAPAHRMRGFETSQQYLNPVVQDQLRLFNEVFDPAAGDAHQPLRDRLRFVVDSLQSVARSTDNDGEDHTVETLDGQMSGAASDRAGGRSPATPININASAENPVRVSGDVDPDNLQWIKRTSLEVAPTLARLRNAPKSIRETISSVAPFVGAGRMTKAPGDAHAKPRPHAASAGANRQSGELIQMLREVDPDTLRWRDGGASGAIHVLALGQSNIANHGVPAASSAFGGVLFEGARRPMADPIPGGSGDGGSVWPRVADRMAASGAASDMLVTLRAVGGTSVADWSDGGAQFEALMADLPEIAKASPPITHVVWHQGERDTLLGTGAEDYDARLMRLHEAVSRHLPNAIWIICGVSYRAGARSDAVRAGQDAIVARAPRCVAGPDTDRLGADFRYDDTHFNERGLQEFARMLAETLKGAPPGAGAQAEDAATAGEGESRRDVERLIGDLEASAGSLETKRAASPGSVPTDLAVRAARRQLDCVFGGFAPEALDAPENADWRAAALERIASAFTRFGVRPDALAGDPGGGERLLFAEGGYEAMMAALRAGEPELALSMARGAPIDQEALYRRWLAPAELEAAADLAAALARYARNERVRPAEPRDDRGGADIRLLLHIGATKTGSTSIQHFLDANRPALLRLGVWAPEIGLSRQSDRPWKTSGHAGFLADARSGRGGLRRALLGGLGALERLGARPHTIVLSSEAFFLSPNATALIDHLGDFRVEMAVYLRRQDDWAEAQYCEFVAGGAIGRVADDPETWLASDATRRLLDYDRMLLEWRDAFAATSGEDDLETRIYVRPYEPDQLRGGDVVADFCALMGVGSALDEGVLTRPAQALRNERAMTAGQIAAMRWMNRLPFPDAEAYLRFAADAERRLAGISGAQARGRPRVFGLETRRRILDSSAPGNAAIARRYLGRQDGRLFLEEELSDAPCEAAALDAAEIDALFEAYVGAGPHWSPPAPVAPPEELVNYGFLGWRRVFKPLIRPIVRRLASRSDARRFEADPAVFLHALDEPHYRFVAHLLYPRWSIYGPFGVVRLWTPLVARAVGRIAGSETRRLFEGQPATFFRSLADPRWRMVGRLLYPCGERPGDQA